MEYLNFDEESNACVSAICDAVTPTQMKYGRKERSKGMFYNIPCSFDIETSSFVTSDVKHSICYIWQWGFGDTLIVYGRTLSSFVECFKRVKMRLNVSINNRLVCYVHNLSFEFQFIKDLFEWFEVFATDRRKPLRAVTNDGLELRCSYLLANASLDQVAKNLTQTKIRKLVGDLDYEKIHTPTTKLTRKELQYAFNDVLIVNAYIKEELMVYKTLNKIPMTSTGKVREFIRSKCLHNNEFYKFMKGNQLSYKEYYMAKLAYGGGHTHSCAVNAFKTWLDVDSYDFTSSYPASLVSEEYPYGHGYQLDEDVLSDVPRVERLMGQYCALVDVTLTNVVNTFYYDSIIPRHKCLECVNEVVDNGKVSCADSLRIVVTEVDYLAYRKFYDFDVKFNCVILFKKTLLPKPLVEVILSLYADKTKLKGVAGFEQEYARLKAMLNAIYGMFVTDIHRTNFEYVDGEWRAIESDVYEELRKYNEDDRRTISYLYGVWCSAYSRRNLWNGLYNVGRRGDVIYMDTDSMKIVNKAKHLEYFEEYNRTITMKLCRTCDRYGLDRALLRPKDKKGIEHPLGVWDYEGRKGFEHSYDAFKTIGAKRYIYLADGELHITIAGVGKKVGAKYLTRKYGKYGAFVAFDSLLVFPPEGTGKLVHTYIDDHQSGDVVDCKGETYHYEECGGIYLEKSMYAISELSAFVSYIDGLRSKPLW